MSFHADKITRYVGDVGRGTKLGGIEREPNDNKINMCPGESSIYFVLKKKKLKNCFISDPGTGPIRKS